MIKLHIHLFINYNFEVVVTFLSFISLNGKTLVFQFSQSFMNFFNTTRTAGHCVPNFLFRLLRILVL
jgi:hypothetical protein